MYFSIKTIIGAAAFFSVVAASPIPQEAGGLVVKREARMPDGGTGGVCTGGYCSDKNDEWYKPDGGSKFKREADAEAEAMRPDNCTGGYCADKNDEWYKPDGGSKVKREAEARRPDCTGGYCADKNDEWYKPDGGSKVKRVARLPSGGGGGECEGAFCADGFGGWHEPGPD